MTRRSHPWIGVTTDTSEAEAGESAHGREPSFFLPQRYCRAVEAAGGLPILLSPIASRAAMRELADRLDGIVLSGGDFDIHPSFYGEKPIAELGKLKRERTDFELELTGIALRRDLPTLGICGGAQTINVALGGSLYQDIAAQHPGAGNHQQSAKKQTGGHVVHIQAGTRLREIVRRSDLEANTTHHQAVKALGKGLIANAAADDGLIEGIESPRQAFLLGVQWHPEVLAPRYTAHRRIFEFFVAACGRRRPR